MQNVAWPMTIVRTENGIAVKVMNELSAMPVMIPGSAIGSTDDEGDGVSRRRSGSGARRSAAIEPSTTAITVARTPHLSDSTSALRTSSLCSATVNHFVENPGIGQLWMLRGVERVEHDQRQRDEQEQQRPPR